MRNKLFLLPLVTAAIATPAYAESAIPETVNYYEMLLHHFHVPHIWVPTVGALFTTLILIILGLAYRAAVAKASEEDIPSGRFSLRFAVDTLLAMPWSVARDNCGAHARGYMSLLAGLFLFILVSNLSGMVPGFEPATISMDTNVAMGIVVFLVYNIAGLKEHGLGYVKHFLGPVALIAPLYLCIELISHTARPLSLGLRLAGNIFADHTLLGVANMVYIIVPSGLMFFGLLVAVIQSFVFTLLSGIYISMATSHDH